MSENPSLTEKDVPTKFVSKWFDYVAIFHRSASDVVKIRKSAGRNGGEKYQIISVGIRKVWTTIEEEEILEVSDGRGIA